MKDYVVLIVFNARAPDGGWLPTDYRLIGDICAKDHDAANELAFQLLEQTHGECRCHSIRVMTSDRQEWWHYS